MKKLRLLAAMPLLLGAAAAAASPAAEAVYKVSHRIALPGDTGWDYLSDDAPAHRLYVSRGIKVQVLDTESEKIVGEIPDTYGVHGIALAPDLGKGLHQQRALRHRDHI